jgi:hypothetical protein
VWGVRPWRLSPTRGRLIASCLRKAPHLALGGTYGKQHMTSYSMATRRGEQNLLGCSAMALSTRLKARRINKAKRASPRTVRSPWNEVRLRTSDRAGEVHRHHHRNFMAGSILRPPGVSIERPGGSPPPGRRPPLKARHRPDLMPSELVRPRPALGLYRFPDAGLAIRVRTHSASA